MAVRSEGTSWRQLKPFLPPKSRLRITLIGATSFLGGLAESAVLVILTLTADALIRNTDTVSLLGTTVPLRAATLVALGAVVVRVALTLFSAFVAARFSSAVMLQAQEDLLTAYLDTAHEVRSARPSGDLTTVAVNHGRMTGDLASGFTSVAASICGLLAFGGTSLAVNPLATVGIAAVGLVVLGAIRPLRSRSKTSARLFADAARVLGQEATEVEALHREIEVFQVGGTVLARMDEQVQEAARRSATVRYWGTAVPQVFQTALLAAAVVSLLFMVGRVGEANLAAVGAVVLLLIRSMSAAQQLVTSNQRVLELSSYAEGMNDLIAALHAGRPNRGNVRPRHLLPVRLHEVGFTYDGATPVLHGVEVEFGSDELVGVVGPSGAGKSTLVELLLGLRWPTEGEILCGGTELRQIDPQEFARRVAFVPQNPVLIVGTVAENVDLFRGLPEQRIRDAIRKANLEAEIDSLPDGIHTRLGPDDRSLSGGQQQRLTIARALAGDPEIVILDEPTSALDAISEVAIRRTLKELASGRLAIVIAHRYSTLKSCSRILALQDGQIESDATPDAVAARSSFFRAMVATES